MTNGDLASSSGIFTPVLSSADIKQGYDDINRLADAVAKATGLDPAQWSLSAIVRNTSATVGFSALQDPNGNAAAPLQGGVKVAGGLLLGSFLTSYTGSTTVTANATGNIGDLTIGTLSAAYRPKAPRGFAWSQGGTAAGAGTINTDGTINLVTLDPGNVVGAAIHVDFCVPL